MRRYELTDAQWKQIEGFFPKNDRRGRPWKDHRQTLNGIFWILQSGASWRDLPERYGCWKTVYERFRRWRDDGFFDRLLERLQARLDEKGLIDWDLWCVDGSIVRAHRCAAGAREKGGLGESPKITRSAVLEGDLEPRYI